MNLFDELLLLLGLEAVVPLCETGFARPILDQDELDRHPGELVFLSDAERKLMRQETEEFSCQAPEMTEIWE